jgi:micrococcal nuclease
MYEYTGSLRRVIDGDTIDATVDLGFSIYHNAILRLRGINAPEMHDKDAAIRAKAKAAKDYLAGRLKDQPLLLHTYKDQDDKYGRMLAVIYVGESNINQELIDKGLAVPYMVGV